MGNSPISWSSKKQTRKATSTMEAEFHALDSACKEAVWLREVLDSIGLKQSKPTTIFGDNAACLKFAHEGRITRQNKHIVTKKFYITNLVKEGIIGPQYMSTKVLTADALTKDLSRETFMKHRKNLGLQKGKIGKGCCSQG